MARTISTSNYFTLGSSPVTGVPLTMVAWARRSAHANGDILAIVDSSAVTNWFAISSRAGGQDFAAQIRAGGGIQRAICSLDLTLDTWHHVAGVFTDVDDRAAFMDGANKGTNTNSVTPSGIDDVSVGALVGSSAINHWNGDLCEAAIYNVALSDAEVALLAKGLSPLLLRPSDLVFYAPLIRNEFESFSGHLTVGGTSPTVVEHVPILYPTRFIGSPPPSSGGGPTTEEVALTLAAELGIALVADAEGEGALILAAELAAVLAGDAVAEGAIGLNFDADVVFVADATSEASVTLAGELAANMAADAEADGAVTLATDLIAAMAADATAEAALTLAAEVDVAFVSEAGVIIEAGLTLAAEFGATFAEDAVAEAALTLAAELAQVEDADAIAEAIVTFAVDLDVVFMADAIAEAGLTLDTIVDLIFVGASGIVLTIPNHYRLYIAADRRTYILTAEGRVGFA